LDAAQEIEPNFLDRAIGILGVIAAIGFCLDWLERRGVSSLGVGRLILGTGMVCSLGFVHALVQGALGKGRSRIWFGVAVFIITALLVTGTRTSLVFALGFVGLIGRERHARLPLPKLLLVIAPVVAGTLVLVPIVASKVLSQPDFLNERMQAALSTFQGGDDQSLQIRVRSYALARERFLDGPWLGGGPGYTYPNGLYTLDTPWMLPAKFGIVGTLAILLYLGCMLVSIRNCRSLTEPLPVFATARGWGLILIGVTPFGPWVEDKGFGVAISLLMAAILAATTKHLAGDVQDAPSIRNESERLGDRLRAPARSRLAPYVPPRLAMVPWRLDLQRCHCE
jgi:hypothetical protein